MLYAGCVNCLCIFVEIEIELKLKLIGVLSKSCTLTCGIPQGTILGPLLFLSYINDLPHCLSNSQPRMYADDTHLTYADNDICSIEASLNQDLSNINRWLIANKLTLNMTKTEFMLIGSRQKLNSLSVLPGLEINGTQLNRVNFTKSLGVLIDENLTWSNVWSVLIISTIRIKSLCNKQFVLTVL